MCKSIYGDMALLSDWPQSGFYVFKTGHWPCSKQWAMKEPTLGYFFFFFSACVSLKYVSVFSPLMYSFNYWILTFLKLLSCIYETIYVLLPLMRLNLLISCEAMNYHCCSFMFVSEAQWHYVACLLSIKWYLYHKMIQLQKWCSIVLICVF